MGLFLFSAEQAAALGRAGVARVIIGAWLVWILMTVLLFGAGVGFEQIGTLRGEGPGGPLRLLASAIGWGFFGWIIALALLALPATWKVLHRSGDLSDPDAFWGAHKRLFVGGIL